MEILEGIKNFLQFIIANWTTIIVIIGLGIVIYKKIKSYLALSQQQKIDLALKSAADVILNLVMSAQAQHGVDAGKAKKSQVLSELYAKFPILTQAINKDELDTRLNTLIDNAIVDMIELLKNKSESVTPTTTIQGIEVDSNAIEAVKIDEEMDKDIVETK